VDKTGFVNQFEKELQTYVNAMVNLSKNEESLDDISYIRQACALLEQRHMLVNKFVTVKRRARELVILQERHKTLEDACKEVAKLALSFFSDDACNIEGFSRIFAVYYSALYPVPNVADKEKNSG